MIQSIFIIGVIISVFAVFAKIEGTRRLVLGFGAVFIFVLLFARDRITSHALKRRERQGIGGERILIAGIESEIADFLNGLDPDATADWDIIGHFDLSKRDAQELFELLKKESIGRVIFAAKSTEFEKVAQSVEVCELQGVEAWIAASFIRTQIARPVFDSVGNKPMLVLRSTPELSWELLTKEFCDRILAVAALLASAPLLLVAVIGIRIYSPGAPVFFSQMRAGKYGRPFRMWKLRTMVPNAEALLENTKREHGNQMDGRFSNWIAIRGSSLSALF